MHKVLITKNKGTLFNSTGSEQMKKSDAEENNHLEIYRGH